MTGTYLRHSCSTFTVSPRNAGERSKEAVGLMEHCGQGGVGGGGAEAVLVAAGGGRPGRGVGVAHPEVRQPRRHAAGHGGVQSQSGGQCVEKECRLRNVPGRNGKYEEKQEIHTHAYFEAKQSKVQYNA